MQLDRLTPEEASSLLRRYPAFTYAALQLMRTAHDPAVRDKMRQHLAATIGSTPDIRELLGADSESLAGFYPDTITPHPTTDKTIEQFIDRFGTQDTPLQYTPGEPVQENHVTNPAADHPAPIPHADSADATSSAIDAFLATVPPPPVPVNLRDNAPASATPSAPKQQTTDASPQTEKRAEESALTESFARILIKNGNYRKALEIMTELNLKNSKKNIYFADQIRFLKKLIVIAKQ